MSDRLETLFGEFREAETNLLRELQRKQQEFYYEIRKGKVHFTEQARARHTDFLKRLGTFLRDSSLLVLLTTPLIWFILLPIGFLDLAMTIYQTVCFPIYGIPKVRRADFILLDRHRLAYLNVIEKLNCQYCGYANGIFAYVTEIAARTEQYWCPIKHALRMKGVHSRYQHFFDYGDAESYRKGIEKVRRDFADLDSKQLRRRGALFEDGATAKRSGRAIDALARRRCRAAVSAFFRRPRPPCLRWENPAVNPQERESLLRGASCSGRLSAPGSA